MPRVIVKRKNRAGAERQCGRCQRTIEPGENYRKWTFRYGGSHFRCFRAECAPRPSELTQSLMGDVYAAIESVQDGMPNAETVADVMALVQEVAETAQEVVDAYREAAEPFGGMGENAERADELEGWQSELESFAPDEGDEDDDEDAIAETMDAARSEADDLLNACPL